MTFEGVVAIVFIIGAILVFHESGHFFFAKLFRMRVDEFGVGLPLKRPIVALKRRETIYSLHWIPFGAFVRIAGMDPEEGHVPNGFHTRPLWQRAIVLVAGSGMNAVLATLLFLLAGVFFGVLVDRTTTIRRTMPGRPAAEAGLLGGDQIVAINDRWISAEVARVRSGTPGESAGLRADDTIVEVGGHEVHDVEDVIRRLATGDTKRVRVTVERWDAQERALSTHRILLPVLEDHAAVLGAVPRRPVPLTVAQLGITFKPLQWDTVTGIIRSSPRQEISVTVVRDGAQITRHMVPDLELQQYIDPETGKTETEQIGLIGVVPQQVYRRLGPLEAVREGFLTTIANVRGLTEAIARMAMGREQPQVMSIVKIAVEIQDSTHLGWWWVLHIGGMISFAIGFLNMLPFPPFDGWKVVYLGYEGIIGRPPDRKKEALINLVGFAVVMFAFVILVFKDVAELVANRAMK